jgi:hypothetical protein
MEPYGIWHVVMWVMVMASGVRSPEHRHRAQGRSQQPAASSHTASQLDRSDFQSTMGSYEGAFSAEPAAGDHPRGGW